MAQIFNNQPQQERDPQTQVIIGAAIEIHRQLGHGFLEAVYQEAAAMEFAERQIPFEREVILPIKYKGKVLKTSYRADFICSPDFIGDWCSTLAHPVCNGNVSCGVSMKKQNLRHL